MAKFGEGTKRIIINGQTIGHATSVKGSRETSTNSTTTFDGVITEGIQHTSHKIDIDRVIYEDELTYRTIREILDDLIDTPGDVTIEEDIITKEEEFTIIRDYKNCILDGDEYEIKPEEHTVNSLSFISSELVEKYSPE